MNWKEETLLTLRVLWSIAKDALAVLLGTLVGVMATTLILLKMGEAIWWLNP